MKTSGTRHFMAAALVGALALLGVSISASAQDVLPRPEQPFKGKIGRTAKESTPDFPKPIEAPQGAPNIVLILTDDVGFGATSTFGGAIPTPTMDQLAKAGLSYNTFHTTALCSPTRSAALGFDYFYGFIGGDTDQWHSAIFEGTIAIEAEEQRGGPGCLNRFSASISGVFAGVRLPSGMAVR